MPNTRDWVRPSAVRWLALSAVGMLSLAGCTQHTPSPPKQVEIAPESPPTAAPANEESITIPECSDINPMAEAEQAEFLESFGAENITAAYGETDRQIFDEFAGPSALRAAEHVTQERSCNWVVYLDSVYLFQFTAELPVAAADALITDLRASDFVESSRGQAKAFSYTFATGDMRGWVSVSHMFIGDVWIVLIENAAQEYEQAAVDAILAANPFLADAAAP